MVYPNFDCLAASCRVFEDLLILFRIAWWTSAGKERTSSFSACILLYRVLIFFVLSYGVWGRKWNSIVSLQYLFIYFLISRIMHYFERCVFLDNPYWEEGDLYNSNMGETNFQEV